jgi:hypothetical protein
MLLQIKRTKKPPQPVRTALTAIKQLQHASSYHKHDDGNESQNANCDEAVCKNVRLVVMRFADVGDFSGRGLRTKRCHGYPSAHKIISRNGNGLIWYWFIR